MVVDFGTWKAKRVRRRVISSRRCARCGTRLLGFPKWREAPREDCKGATEERGGWVEFEEACAYGCEAEKR